MTNARNRHGEDDPGAQILASTSAFRGWALAHPAEFGLIFANVASASPFDVARPNDPSLAGGAAFAGYFSDIFMRLWNRYQFSVPTDAELDSALLQRLVDQRAAGTLPCDFPGHPMGLSWVFIRCWTRPYGTVTLEVFRHMDRGVIDSGALFVAMLDDNARDLGFGDDWPRLRRLVEQQLINR